MTPTRQPLLASALTLVVMMAIASPALAEEARQAKGTVTLDATQTTLAHAVSGKTANLFDESRKDTIVVLADRDLGDLSPDDEIGIDLRARAGDLVALALRLDGAKLVNVAVHAKGLDGMVILPGAWFTYRPGVGGPGTGSLSLASRESDGHTYACSVEFTAAPAKPARPATPAPAEATPAAPTPTPTLPPASTSSIEPKALTALIVAAMMKKDEDQAVKLIKTGADPNSRDQYGTPLLNWAVMVCMPRAVKTLVDRGADLKYERAPGMTIMTEAGACPEAAKILKVAGAR